MTRPLVTAPTPGAADVPQVRVEQVLPVSVRETRPGVEARRRQVVDVGHRPDRVVGRTPGLVARTRTSRDARARGAAMQGNTAVRVARIGRLAATEAATDGTSEVGPA